MKYLCVQLSLWLSWALLAWRGYEKWETAKNGDGMYVVFIVLLLGVLVYVIAQEVLKAFKRDDKTIGQYTDVSDEYDEMRERFRKDKRDRS